MVGSVLYMVNSKVPGRVLIHAETIVYQGYKHKPAYCRKWVGVQIHYTRGMRVLTVRISFPCRWEIVLEVLVSVNVLKKRKHLTWNQERHCNSKEQHEERHRGMAVIQS